MSARSKLTLKLVAALIGGLILTKLIYRWPDLFPGALRALGNTLIGLSGSDSAEVNSNIELAFVFLISIAISFLVILIIASACSRLTQRDDTQGQ